MYYIALDNYILYRVSDCRNKLIFHWKIKTDTPVKLLHVEPCDNTCISLSTKGLLSYQSSNIDCCHQVSFLNSYIYRNDNKLRQLQYY